MAGSGGCRDAVPLRSAQMTGQQKRKQKTSSPTGGDRNPKKHLLLHYSYILRSVRSCSNCHCVYYGRSSQLCVYIYCAYPWRSTLVCFFSHFFFFLLLLSFFLTSRAKYMPRQSVQPITSVVSGREANISISS